ncbi:MAG: phage virion morphogenesis protein [Aquificaceae bacterium]
MIKITIEDKKVKEILERLTEKTQDLSPLMKRIGGIMLSAVEENFEQEGRPKWSPLSSKTIKQREKKGHWPGKILQLSGRLASSISMSYSKDSAIVGTNVKYASTHQFGFQGLVSVRTHERKGKPVKAHPRKMNIPARPFLKLTDEDMQKIKEAMLEYLKAL